MHKIAPLTKLILTVAVSLWAILLHSLAGLVTLVAAQILTIAFARVSGKVYKAVFSLCVFAVLLVGLQYAFGSSLTAALVSGLRMAAMTLVFVILLTTTRVQDITAALVSQCRVPYEYAFMFTAALRFIPDFLAESKAVQEAQACRGYAPSGNVFKRMLSYLAIVEPLVLRAITRSETMAMSLELRGFGAAGRSFTANVALNSIDYLLIMLMVVGSAIALLLVF